MTSPPIPETDYERTVVRNVAEYGWHVTHVFPGEDDTTPGFTYSVGLHATWGHPEILVFGLPQDVAHGVISDIANAAAEGRPLDLDQPDETLLVGYPCVFVAVPPGPREEHARSAAWFYGWQDFPLYQLVWPSREGLFPWHPKATAGFREAQPVLGAPVA